MGIQTIHRDKFIKLAEELDALMKEIREYNPEANYYLAMETLNLMNGEHHSLSGIPHEENVVESVIIQGADGGDW